MSNSCEISEVLSDIGVEKDELNKILSEIDSDFNITIFKLKTGLLTDKIPDNSAISDVFGIDSDKIDEITNNIFKKLKLSSKKDDIKSLITSCVKEFNGKYGRSGIAKILKGSQGLKENIFNNASINSEFFGVLNNETTAKITSKIDELIEDKTLLIKKISFGRPTLIVNPQVCEKIEIQENDDDNIKEILKLVKNKRNIFITGHAGTGKSYILSKLKEKLKHLVITSTTGIASVNVKGQTLHSWAGVGICNKPIEKTVENILKKSSIKKQIEKCKILAIDEVSMLDIKTFEYVNEVLKSVRKNDEPFGGIQVILIGDFFQLPPVDKLNSSAKYCFESPLWEEFNFANIILKKSYRQNEADFIKALANMRINSLDRDDINLLKTRECKDDKNLGDILHIFATNQEADNYNIEKYGNIVSKEYILQATDGIFHGKDFISAPTNEKEEKIFNRIDVSCNADKIIPLKIGARVMLLVNLDFDKGLINGSCGVVRDIKDDYIEVRFDNGIISKIQKHDFEFYNNETLVALREQFPLKLAYGITIHKSQGMSLDKLFVDCSRIFERGQAYVALSRIKTLEGLYLKDFSANKVMVDDKIVEFYKNLA